MNSDDYQLMENYDHLPMVEMTNQHAAFAARLNAAMQKTGATISDLMVMAGVTYEMARRYTKGTARPREDKLLLIAKGLGISPSKLAYDESNAVSLENAQTEKNQTPIEPNAVESSLTPVVWDDEDQDSDEFFSVPLLNIELAAGDGAAVLVEREKYKLPFRRHTLRKQNVDPAGAKVVRIIGNSMTPILSNGDVVGVDVTKTDIIDGDTYAIRDGDLLRVKILISRPDGGVTIRSFNDKDYPDECLSKQEKNERIIVIGRVWWSSKLW